MTTLIIIRHGQSEANAQNVFAGQLDMKLNELGFQQAECTASCIAENFKVDKVYASDLHRAYYTGKAVADKFGLDVIKSEKLREIFSGDWQGRTYDEIGSVYASGWNIWLTDIGSVQTPGGESVKDLMDRVGAEIRRIAEENDGKTVVIATHATSIRVFFAYAQEKALSEIKDIPFVTNASFTVCEYENGKFNLTRISEDAHLGEKKTSFPANV